MTKKKIEELTPEEMSKVKVTFAPGCFDHFEGTQEELNELIAEISQMIHSGEFFEQSVDLSEFNEDELEELGHMLSNTQTSRTLQ